MHSDLQSYRSAVYELYGQTLQVNDKKDDKKDADI